MYVSYDRDKSIGDYVDIAITKIIHLKDYDGDPDDKNETSFDSTHYLKVVPEANDMLNEFCSWEKRNHLKMDNLSNINVIFQDQGMKVIKDPAREI